MKRIFSLVLGCTVVGVCSLAAPGCGTDGGSDFEENDGGSSSGASGASGSNGGFTSGANGDGGASSGGGQLGDGAACEAASARAQRPPLTLIMGLDQSCSMGDCGGQERARRWVPVTTALKAFWDNPATTGISASLTLFPDGNGGGGNPSPFCNDDRYTEPDVGLTPLPNSAPFMALPSLAPSYNPDRTATPTRAVLRGLAGDANEVLAATPTAKVAVVLVTDGDPNYCGGADSIEQVQSAIEGQPFPTYVIAIAGVSGGYADEIADAGGTSVDDGGPGAFYVDVDDPGATQTAFTSAMDQIRGALVPSCELAIPPPPAGQTFDKNKVNVTITSGATGNALGYDPACVGPGWKYNDPNAPTHVVLCPQSCDPFKADPNAQLDVAFGCATRPSGVN